MTPVNNWNRNSDFKLTHYPLAGPLDKIAHPLLEFASFHDTLGQGKRVQNPRGPAAVNGDETRRRHCSPIGEWEGAGSRMNHKPEDLPEEDPLFPRGLGNRRG